MIVSLPMYDRPETRAANEQLWKLLKGALGSNAELSFPDDPMVQWHDPDLLFSQTCGMPYRKRLHGKVNIVASPVHAIDAPAGHYHSVLVTRKSDDRTHLAEFEAAPLAVNDPMSQSGFSAPMTLAASLGFQFNNIRPSGAHRVSATMVADGRADIAAIDAVTWAMIQRWDDYAYQLRELAKTPPTPALPYITSLNQNPDAVRSALANSIAQLTEKERETLLLRGITFISSDKYLAVNSVV